MGAVATTTAPQASCPSPLVALPSHVIVILPTSVRRLIVIAGDVFFPALFPDLDLMEDQRAGVVLNQTGHQFAGVRIWGIDDRGGIVHDLIEDIAECEVGCADAVFGDSQNDLLPGGQSAGRRGNEKRYRDRNADRRP